MLSVLQAVATKYVISRTLDPGVYNLF